MYIINVDRINKDTDFDSDSSRVQSLAVALVYKQSSKCTAECCMDKAKLHQPGKLH